MINGYMLRVIRGNMLISDFIQISEIKEKFTKRFPLAREGVSNWDIRASPIAHDKFLVRTAFDYLFRFLVERENPHHQECRWKAEDAVKLSKWVAGGMEVEDKDLNQVKSKMEAYLENAKIEYYGYLNSGNITNKLIESAIVLARMDEYVQGSDLIPEIMGTDEKDVRDLCNQLKLVRTETFRTNGPCYLNPVIWDGRHRECGIRVNLICDGVLIDVNTTEHSSFTQDDYNQLIFYYMLSRIGKINEFEEIKISKMKMYFSRYVRSRTISAKEIEETPGFTEFADWFENTAMGIFKRWSVGYVNTSDGFRAP